MVNEKEKEIWNKRLAGVGLGRSTTEDNLAVLLWPRKIWTTREVPYMISHSSDAESMFLYLLSFDINVYKLNLLSIAIRCF